MWFDPSDPVPSGAHLGGGQPGTFSKPAQNSSLGANHPSWGGVNKRCPGPSGAVNSERGGAIMLREGKSRFLLSFSKKKKHDFFLKYTKGLPSMKAKEHRNGEVRTNRRQETKIEAGDEGEETEIRAEGSNGCVFIATEAFVLRVPIFF